MCRFNILNCFTKIPIHIHNLLFKKKIVKKESDDIDNINYTNNLNTISSDTSIYTDDQYIETTTYWGHFVDFDDD